MRDHDPKGGTDMNVSEKPSPLGTIESPARYILTDDVKKAMEYRRARIRFETDFVAKLMADNKKQSDSLIIDGCMQNPEMWESQKLYHLYMFLMFFVSDGETDGFWKRMQELGKRLNAEESMT